jgi:hypothetical protein
MSQERKEGFRDFIKTVIPSWSERADQIVDDTEASFYSMERARRALGIQEPDEGTLEQARRDFAKSQKMGD